MESYTDAQLDHSLSTALEHEKSHKAGHIVQLVTIYSPQVSVHVLITAENSSEYLSLTFCDIWGESDCQKPNPVNSVYDALASDASDP